MGVRLMREAAQVDKRERTESGVAGLQVDSDARMRGELRSAGGAPNPPPRHAHAEAYEPARGVRFFSAISAWKRLLGPARTPSACEHKGILACERGGCTRPRVRRRLDKDTVDCPPIV